MQTEIAMSNSNSISNNNSQVKEIKVLRRNIFPKFPQNGFRKASNKTDISLSTTSSSSLFSSFGDVNHSNERIVAKRRRSDRYGEVDKGDDPPPSRSQCRRISKMLSVKKLSRCKKEITTNNSTNSNRSNSKDHTQEIDLTKRHYTNLNKMQPQNINGPVSSSDEKMDKGDDPPPSRSQSRRISRILSLKKRSSYKKENTARGSNRSNMKDNNPEKDLTRRHHTNVNKMQPHNITDPTVSSSDENQQVRRNVRTGKSLHPIKLKQKLQRRGNLKDLDNIMLKQKPTRHTNTSMSSDVKNRGEIEVSESLKGIPHPWFFWNNHLLVNRERAMRGIPQLKRNIELDALAREAATQLATSNLITVTTKYHGNIVRGTSVREIHQALMKHKRSEHRAHILNPEFTEFGMGTAKAIDGSLYLCQFFGPSPFL